MNRALLPIASHRREIIARVRENQVVLVRGATGCGKTTQISQYLIDDEKDWRNSEDVSKAAVVGITNPRRVGAVSVARRVAQERGCRVGDEVGFVVRFTDATGPRTRIIYLTDGSLLRECIEDPKLLRYSAVVLDEAHERSVNTDVLIGILRRVLESRPEFRLLVTSATMDCEKFRIFFGPATPVIDVRGRSFPVKVVNLDPMAASDPGRQQQIESQQSLTNLAPIVDVVTKIHLLEEPGDILVFLTGQEEIHRACNEIEERMRQLIEDHPEDLLNAQDLLVLPLYAALPPDEQVAVFEPAPPNTRKAILATNLAETSLTIDGIVYVVDSGYVKQSWWNFRAGVETLRIALISKNAAEQRAGRAGRTRPGKCFRLYSKALFDDMEANTVPEIKRASLHSTVLYLRELCVEDLGSFNFLDAPDDAALVESLIHLFHLGAIDGAGKVTDLGHVMAQFPVEPVLARVLIDAARSGIAEPTACLVAALSAENIFHRGGRNQQEEADAARTELARLAEAAYGPGDHMMLLFAFEQWRRSEDRRGMCRKYFVNQNAMMTADQIRSQLIEHLHTQRLLVGGEPPKPVTFEAIMRSLLSGYHLHTARRQLNQPSFLLNNKTVQPSVLIHPSSVLSGREESLAWVLFSQLTFTSRGFLRYVTPVPWEWIKPFYEASASADLRNLIGPTLFERSQQEKQRSAALSGEKRTASEVSGETVAEPSSKMEAKMKRTVSEDAIEAARQRYLARKKGK